MSSEPSQHSNAAQPSTSVTTTANAVTSGHYLNQNQNERHVSFQSHTQLQPAYSDHIQPESGYSSFGNQVPGYGGPVQTHQQHGLNSDSAEPVAIRSSFAVGVSTCLYFGKKFHWVGNENT